GVSRNSSNATSPKPEGSLGFQTITLTASLFSGATLGKSIKIEELGDSIDVGERPNADATTWAQVSNRVSVTNRPAPLTLPVESKIRAMAKSKWLVMPFQAYFSKQKRD